MNYEDEITRIFNLFLHSNLDLTSIVFSLTIATVMGFLISLLYRKTHRGLNYEHTFMATLVIMAPIISIVMLYIRGDLVLSLGLIGSLSIVRFRTPIKDTRDMVFLFWVIAIGLGAGTYNWGVVVISTIFITIVVTLLYFFRYGNSRNTDFILVISGNLSIETEEILNVVKQFASEARIRSLEQDNEKWEIVIELRLVSLAEVRAEKIIAQLQGIKSVSRVSLLAPQLALPL